MIVNGNISTYNLNKFKEVRKQYIKLKKEKNLFLLLNPLSLMFFIISSVLTIAIANRMLKINDHKKYIQALTILGLIGCLIDFYVNFRTYIIQPRENKLLLELEDLDKQLQAASKTTPLKEQHGIASTNLLKGTGNAKIISAHMRAQLESAAEEALGKIIRYLFLIYSGVFLTLQIIDTLEVFRPFALSNKVIMTSVSLGATLIGLAGATLSLFRYYTQEKGKSPDMANSAAEKSWDFSAILLILGCTATVISIVAKILSYYDYIQNLEIPVVELIMIASYAIGLFVCGYQLKKGLNESLNTVLTNCEFEGLEMVNTVS